MNTSVPLFLKKNYKKIELLFVFIVYVFLLKKLFLLDPILGFDDHSLIKSILHSNLSILIHPVYDIQPVRDLSYIFDAFFKYNYNYWGFHFTNFIIWCLILLNVQFLFNKLITNKLLNSVAFILFSFHPVFLNLVPWIAARKHLLAFLFLTIALRSILSDKKHKALGLNIFYFLSVFSQPLFVFFPLWAIGYLRFYKKQKISDNLTLILPMIITMIICLILNYNYYSEAVPGKFILDSSEKFQMIPQSFGRYFFNIIFPYHLSISYRVFSIPNLIGSVLLFVGGFYAFKRDRPLFLTWASFGFLSLILVTINITNVFVTDSYVFYFAFAFFVIFFVFLERSFLKYQVVTLVFTLFLLASYINQDFYMANYWTNTHDLYKNAHLLEPDFFTSFRYIYLLMNSPEPLKNFKTIVDVINDYNHKEFADKLIEIIFKNSSLTKKEKIVFLNQIKVNTPLKARAIEALN
jgi:hypothetical protein